MICSSWILVDSIFTIKMVFCELKLVGLWEWYSWIHDSKICVQAHWQSPFQYLLYCQGEHAYDISY